MLVVGILSVLGSVGWVLVMMFHNVAMVCVLDQLDLIKGVDYGGVVECHR